MQGVCKNLSTQGEGGSLKDLIGRIYIYRFDGIWDNSEALQCESRAFESVGAKKKASLFLNSTFSAC